jgi:hypothetical protein
MVGAFVGFYAAKALKLQSSPRSRGAAQLLPVLLITMLVCALLGL